MKGDEVPEVLDCLRDVPAPDGDRQAAKREALLAQAHHHRVVSVSTAEAERRPRRGVHLLRPRLSRRYAMLVISVAVALAMVTSVGGVVYAADGAVPGDVLYCVDRAIESVKLSLTNEPEVATGLLLGFAQERLEEAEELAELGDEGNLQRAMHSYGETISSVAQTLGTTEVVDEAVLASVLDTALSAHEDQLTRIFLAMSDGEADEPEDNGSDEAGEGGRCVGIELHPRGNALGESYEVPYEDVMTWFCDGYGFGEIMHALETSRAAGISASAQELLAMKTEMGGWGKVWQELGLIGKSAYGLDGDAPADEPDDALEYRPSGGPPDDVPGLGPRDDKPGGGPPDDKPDRGPRDDKPGGGPPDDKPGEGPPDDKPGGGPPDDKPGGGPPEDRPNTSPVNQGRGRGKGRKR